MVKKYCVLILLIILSACQNRPRTYTPPTEQPFPTMTLGQGLVGQLGTPGPRPNAAAIGNPATAAALAIRTTPTPNTSSCPNLSENVRLGAYPTSRTAASEALLAFLNSGGSPTNLQRAIQDNWAAFGETGFLQSDIDLTGEGRAEIVLAYTAPVDVGVLVIFACQDGRYSQVYEVTADGRAAPQLIWLGEMNNNSPAELVFARRQCLNADTCDYQTQIIAWSGEQGRFVNLLAQNLITLDLPSVRDMDNDAVAELIVNLNSNGNSETGPLRTGVNIYDWNGESYLLSIPQLNPPRYGIQVVQEGDKAFSRLDMPTAIDIYQVALNDDNLRTWFNDDATQVNSYAYYRIILAYAYLGNGGAVLDTLTRLNDAFPVPEGQALEDAPIYVHMANVFVQNLQNSNDLHASCEAVQTLIASDRDALGLINRYGTQSPTYTALDLCPY